MGDQRPRGEGGPEGTTIVAPATPAGIGAVAILRLSGPRSFAIAARMTGLDPRRLPPRRLSRCTVRDGDGAEIDAGLAAFFPGPGSFSGEDLAEIHLHGSPVVVERAGRAALSLGAVPAAPGEFSRRAYLNGKIDLTQAEAMADLITARTTAAAEAALRQLKGGIGRAVAPLREGLVSLLALLEASIDFGDDAEEIPDLGGDQLKARVSELRFALAGLAGSYDRGRRIRDGATVAIAGVANVGKSSLLNRLVGEERAIVAELPGTTRDYLAGEIVLGGIPVRLVDTAGLREAADPVEREGVRRSREIIAAADVVLFVLDGSREAGEGDRSAYDEVAALPHIVVVNKTDLPRAGTDAPFRGGGFRGVAPVSARTGEGVDPLLASLGREVVSAAGEISDEAPLTRLRHLEAVRKAEEPLARAEEAIRRKLPAEFVAADIREAVRALGALTGEIDTDELLDAIFATFCIGK